MIASVAPEAEVIIGSHSRSQARTERLDQPEGEGECTWQAFALPVVNLPTPRSPTRRCGVPLGGGN
jgi:hypothetical protein